jgi:Tfp pilus assembly protein PilO
MVSKAIVKEKLIEILNKIPFPLVYLGIIGTLGYHYYDLNYPEASKLKQTEATLVSVQGESAKIEDNIRKANEFKKRLETKRAEIRQMAQELDSMKATLSENLDIPAFVKMVVTEARKVGLMVTGIKPSPEQVRKEYYAEQAFDLNFRGVYAQLLVFLDRLSQAQKIVRVDNFTVHPIATASISRYVELEGLVQVKAYYYLGSKADDIARGGGASPGAARPSVPVAAPAAGAVEGEGT